ncbi:ferredoxin [Actinomadura barringtoniae]|uniref:Ferredoxin n=1 Tax=Actinomadura barringtoniae TaxID=1427535 RepID=A0A939T969_9ACTN|nr:ferredoxin [Actinomadura barringtoniae]MBO2447670.1 ferredoxin [Actinomadura barringtoniae]
MRIDVDWDACEGHGLCEESAPAVFTVDDDGDLTYHFDGVDIPAEHEEAARSAIGVCPVIALRLVP